MAPSRKRPRLLAAYRFPGFRPLEEIHGIFGDPKARVVTLVRRSKKQSALPAAGRIRVGTTARRAGCAISPAAIRGFIWRSRFGAYAAEAVRGGSGSGSV